MTAPTIARIIVRIRPTNSQDAWQYYDFDPSESNIRIPDVDMTVNYTIEARSRSTCGMYSDWVSVAHTVLGGTDGPIAPINLTVTSVADGNALKWDFASTPHADQSIEVHRSISGAGVFSKIHTAPVTGWTDPVIDGTNYDYEVRAVDIRGNVSLFSGIVSSASKVTPSTGSLPNVIGTTAQFTSVAAQWSEVALSDNSKFADLRCGFTCTCTVTDGDTEGYIEFKVTSDATAANANITLVHASSGIGVTQARLRDDGAHHVALDIYMTRTGAKVQVAVAPITGTWNAAAAVAGTVPAGGTVLRSWNMDPANTGSHPGGTGHTGLADKAHQLIASGEVYHGGVQVLDPNQNFVPGADKVPDGNVRKVVTVGTIAARPAATGSQSHYLAVDGSSVATKAVVFRDKGVRTAPA